ncbi:MAG: hypothetical protein AB1631_06630 [Acidobacteriota bacterium]
MRSKSETLFDENFLDTLKSLIELHHSIYLRIPPQGIFFESLVEQAFKRSGWPADQVVLSATNTPSHDLSVGDARLSLKTETGAGTRADRISITKLCTTEKEPWDSPTLISHAMDHLSRYDHILMLRAVWRSDSIHYQLIEIPIDTLKFLGRAEVLPVGKRKGRKSMAADIYSEGEKLFRVHFDGADGKCQIHRLPLSQCRLLLEWDQPVSH